MSRIRTSIWVGLICVLVLTGCGFGESAPESTPTPEPTSTPEPTATAEPEIALEVQTPVWSGSLNANGSPTESLEWAPTDISTIYAVFRTSAIREGTIFQVSWVMNGTPVPGLNPTLSITADTPPGWIEIHLDRSSDQNWPSGLLQIQLSVGGEVVAQGSIELRDR